MEADRPTIGEYTLTCKLGGGSSSTVWKAEHRTTGKVVALKQIDLLKLTRQLKSCLDCELSFLSSVKHPNIIRLFDVFQVSGVSLSLRSTKLSNCFSRYPEYLLPTFHCTRRIWAANT